MLDIDGARIARFFEVSHGGHRRIRSMEGMRGFAVALVFLVHYVTLSEPWLASAPWTLALARELKEVGKSGVDLFFVLSGYLIYGMLIRKPVPLGRYFARRIQRIYPVFLTVLGIYLLLSWLIPSHSRIPEAIPTALEYIVANILLLPGMFRIEPIITVAWSLSYEAFYYIAAPALIGVLGLRRWKSPHRIALFLALVLGVFAYSSLHGGQARLTMFIAGVLLFEAIEFQPLRRVGLTGLLALFAGLIAIATIATGLARFAVLFVSFFLLCYASFSHDGVTSRIFSWTPLRWLGNMSYSYFLIHGLALIALFAVLSRTVGRVPFPFVWFWIGMPIMLVLTLPAAVTLFGMVERPFSLGNREGKPPLPSAIQDR